MAFRSFYFAALTTNLCLLLLPRSSEAALRHATLLSPNIEVDATSIHQEITSAEPDVKQFRVHPVTLQAEGQFKSIAKTGGSSFVQRHDRALQGASEAYPSGLLEIEANNELTILSHVWSSSTLKQAADAAGMGGSVDALLESLTLYLGIKRSMMGNSTTEGRELLEMELGFPLRQDDDQARHLTEVNTRMTPEMRKLADEKEEVIKEIDALVLDGFTTSKCYENFKGAVGSTIALGIAGVLLAKASKTAYYAVATQAGKEVGELVAIEGAKSTAEELAEEVAVEIGTVAAKDLAKKVVKKFTEKALVKKVLSKTSAGLFLERNKLASSDSSDIKSFAESFYSSLNSVYVTTGRILDIIRKALVSLLSPLTLILLIAEIGLALVNPFVGALTGFAFAVLSFAYYVYGTVSKCDFSGNCPTETGIGLGKTCCNTTNCQSGFFCIDNRCSVLFFDQSKAGTDCDADEICQPAPDAPNFCSDGGVCFDCDINATETGCILGTTCESINGTKTTASVCASSCTTAEQCFQGVCHENSCVDCNVAVAIGLNLQGRCLVPGAICTVDDDDGAECTSGICDLDKCFGCNDDTDCKNGSVCVDVVDDADQLLYKTCLDSCSEDENCPTGICDPSAKVCVECRESNECGSDLRCSAFRCMEKLGLGGSCSDASDCEASLRCNTVGSTCEEKLGMDAQCSSNDDCVEGLRCGESAGMRTCREKLEIGMGCLEESDCKSNICNGFCSECFSNGQCEDFQRCNLVDAFEEDSPALCTRKARKSESCFQMSDCSTGLSCDGATVDSSFNNFVLGTCRKGSKAKSSKSDQKTEETKKSKNDKSSTSGMKVASNKASKSSKGTIAPNSKL